MKKSFEKIYGLNNNISVLYNPVDTNAIKELSKMETDLPYKSDCFNICSIGRLCEQKGFDRLIRIAELLKKDYKDFCIYIIGEGPAKEKLKDMIKKKNLENNVNLLGYIRNPYPYLKNADLYVCSSRAEGYSTVATEALILQVPSIVTDCSGMSEIYNNGEYGIITKNDEQDLYEKLRDLIIDENYYKQLLQKSVKGTDVYEIKKLIGDLQNFIISNIKYQREGSYAG